MFTVRASSNHMSDLVQKRSTRDARRTSTVATAIRATAVLPKGGPSGSPSAACGSNRSGVAPFDVEVPPAGACPATPGAARSGAATGAPVAPASEGGGGATAPGAVTEEGPGGAASMVRMVPSTVTQVGYPGRILH
jgi:hypothetical protein